MNINTVDNKEKGRKPFEGTEAYNIGYKNGIKKYKDLTLAWIYESYMLASDKEELYKFLTDTIYLLNEEFEK